MVPASSLGEFLAPRKLDLLEHLRFNGEASKRSTLILDYNNKFTLSLLGFCTSRQVEENKRGEHVLASKPSATEGQRGCNTSRTLPSMALRTALDKFLTPCNGEYVQRCEIDLKATTSPPKSEGKPKLNLSEHIPFENSTELANGVAKPRYEAASPYEADLAKPYEADQAKSESRCRRLTKQAVRRATATRSCVGFPSRGSKNHYCGKCHPCRHVQDGSECPHGVLCNFCHLPHQSIQRKTMFDQAFLTSEAPAVDSPSQCDSCETVLEDSSPWYIQLPSMHKAS